MDTKHTSPQPALKVISTGSEPPPCMLEKAGLILNNSRTARFAYITGKYELAAMTENAFKELGEPGRLAFDRRDPKGLWELAKKARAFGAVQIYVK